MRETRGQDKLYAHAQNAAIIPPKRGKTIYGSTFQNARTRGKIGWLVIDDEFNTANMY